MPRFAASCHTCTLLGLVTLGCSITRPVPLPDAAQPTGLELIARPRELVIRPGSSGRVRFQLVDRDAQPVPGYPVEFSIPSQSTDNAVARLGTQQSLTDARGETVAEIIVGALSGSDRKAEFWVEATSPGAAPVPVLVTVTTDAYSVEIQPALAEDLLGLATVIQKTRLYFFDDLACSDIDIHHVTNLAGQARRREVGGLSAEQFNGVAPSGVHAVAGEGLDSAGVARAGGCVDVPGPALLDDVTIRALLVLDHLFPSLSGGYLSELDFQFVSAPTALATILSTFQQWSSCQLDPARLWLDCSIAALDPHAKPCVPVAGSGSLLVDRLLTTRGALLSSEASCRSDTDSNGDPSLDAVAYALFSDRGGQLAAASLANLPTELSTLLTSVRLSSQMAFAPAIAPNAYWVDHELLGISFPKANVSFGIAKLGLPVSKATGILATFRADPVSQVTLADHGFTLRLGTAARYAFEATSLAVRKIDDCAGLVEAIFGLAQWNDESGPLTGCAALDAVACARVGEPRGCLLKACSIGLTALAGKLAGAFDSLDGDGIDLNLACSAPVVDHNTDGRADALGVASSLGYCRAVVGNPAVGYGMDVYWQGSRPGATP